MNKFIFALASLTVLSIGFASQAQAGSRGSSSHASSGSYQRSNYVSSGSYQRSYQANSYVNPGRYSNYNQSYGTRFAHGYYYGRGYNQWSISRYDARYGCTCYYDPCCSAWYYWCEPASCYYPITYCPYNSYCWE